MAIPTLYKDVAGFMNFEGLYDYVINNTPLKFKAVELGVWQGRSAVYLLEKCVLEDKICQLDCIDTWKFDHPLVKINEGNIVNLFVDNIKQAGFIRDINVIQVNSIKAACLYDDKSLDFVMIDTDHLYENTKNEIDVWYSKLKHGGFMGFDDYNNPDFVGVKQAVDEFVEEKQAIIDFTKSDLSIFSMLIKFK
jgi:hypothetical protein